MASPIDSSQAAAKRKSLRTRRKSKIEVLGMKIPAHPWVATAFTCFLILGAVGSLAIKVILPAVDEWVKFKTEESRAAKEAIQKTNLRFAEYQKHLPETPEKIVDKPDLMVSFYSSDGCLVVRRKGPNNAPIDNWIPAVSVPVEQPPKLSGANDSMLPKSGYDSNASAYSLASLNPTLTANAAETSAEPQGCSGRCVDPHPGPFQSWNGQQNGCWIQVWRKWPEGCQHYQWYNSCNGYWDSYPNGAPKVFWTCCVH